MHTDTKAASQHRSRTTSTVPSIETISLRKQYGDHVAVQNLTLRVEPGEVFGFLGPNGAGKTTSVKMLVGLIRPTSGSAQILGRPLGDRNAQKKIGFLPELFRFHDWLRGDELLTLHGRLYGMSKANRERRIPEVLDLVGLSDAARQRVRTYSKGMQQRIGLAQALLNEPELVFLDEPTSALDPLGRRDVRRIVERLRDEGVTVFLNSHLLSEVESVCTRAAIVNRGQVVAIGPMSELLHGAMLVRLRLSSFPSEVRAALARSTSIESVEDGERTEVVIRASDEEEIARAVDELISAGVSVYGVTPERRTLEDAFLDIIASDQKPGER